MADYFSYEGRLNRWPYFLRYIGCLVAYFILVIFLSIMVGIVAYSNTAIGNIITILISFLILIAALIMLVFMLMQAIKRLHDLDKSGWYLLIRLAGIIPLIGWIIVLGFDLYLFLAKGTTGPNRFGPDPLGGEASQSNDTVQSLNSDAVDAEYEDINETEE